MHISFFLALMFFTVQSDSYPLNVYYNGQLVDPKVGISLADFPSPSKQATLSFTLDAEIDNKEDLTFIMDLAVVRSATAVRSRYYRGVRQNEELDAQPVLQVLQPGDNILLDFSKSPGLKPKLYVIRVRK